MASVSEKKETEIKTWRSRIKRSYRAKQDHRETWDRCYDHYLGNAFDHTSAMDRVSVNWIFSTVRQMMAHLYFQNPTMYFRPLTEKADATGAPLIMEAVMKFERRLMDSEGEERKALFNALVAGTGIMKHGYNAQYDTEFPYSENAPKEAVDGFAAAEINPTGDLLQEDLDMPDSYTTEYHAGVKEGHPWKMSISPYDFFIDPEALTFEEARWMAHRFRRPWAEVLRDQRYDRDARKKIRPQGQSEWYSDAEYDEDDPSVWTRDSEVVDSSMVTLYEIYDRTTKRIIVMSSDCDMPLLEKQFPFFGEDGPYEVLQFFPRPDSFWALPYVDTFSDQVDVLNKMRTKMYDHLSRWGNIKAAVARGALSEDDAKKWAAAQTAEIAQLDIWGDQSIQETIQVFPYPPLPGDGWRLSDMFYGDLQEVSGVSEMDRGSGKAINTATEASYIQQQSGLRTDDMRYLFEKFLKRSVRKVVSILRQFWGPERVVPIVGPAGAQWQFLRVPQEVVNSRYEVDIEPGSTERIDKNVRVRQTIDAIRELVPLIPHLQQQGHNLNLVELVRIYIKNTDLTRNPDKLLVPLPPPEPQPQPQPQQGMGAEAENVNMMGQMPWQEQAGIQGDTQAAMMGGAA